MRPLVMGILNVTPDSFSDGGMFLRREDALSQAERLVREGADIIDVGGESSRPGAQPVELDEELSRIIPVIEGIKKRFDVRISVDTVKPDVAKFAIDHGATLINDISGGSDLKMAEQSKRPGVDTILMHMRGTPVTMQIQPFYPRGVVEEVKEFLTERRRQFVEAGVSPQNIWVDPGIGFGKTVNHCLEILRRLPDLKGLGERVVIGTSRKSFLAHLLGGPQVDMEDRISASVATSLWAYDGGASVFRVHDVGEFRRALTVWEALRHGGQ